jgi:tetratricopeptide (TPR) repeat protein
MEPTLLSRFWNAVKPPPSAQPEAEEHLSLTPKQKQLLRIAAGVVAAGAIGTFVYLYIGGAQDRAIVKFQAGMRAMRPGSYDESIKLLTQSITIWSTPDAYLERGAAHHYLGEDDQAVTDFTKALELNPNLPRAFSGRGTIYRARGNFKGALEEFNRSLAIEPNVDAYYERGEIFEALGDHQKAIADYDKAVQELVGAPYVYRARSIAKRNIGDMAGYEADRDKAKDLEKLH